ncbi:peptidase S8 [Lentzea sp. NBRC 105346]|uniref:S8 family peptidase n=1 Tax=Lentzea sp. NBRC 105346 TaxID=3032205 RepID=UPI0024A07BBC|nr:S8 family serine peptidase [Lentzea sp. NBRC 105346]GLZ28573.1 peptidase S8 [Lentzea sp. NBRC 105346]
MTIRFPDHEHTGQAAYPNLAAWPPWLLEKHGAQMLDPATATRTDATNTLRSTVYRNAVLLFPRAVLTDTAVRGRIEDEVLGPMGLTLRDSDNEFPPVTLPEELAGLDQELLRRFPVPVALNVRAGARAVVDAWEAVQAIRLWARRDGGVELADDAGAEETRREEVLATSVEHLLVGANFNGVPTWGPGDVRDEDGGSGGSAYRLIPVAFTGPRPVRQPCARRVVVAVPDTGVNVHPWFGVSKVGDPLPPNGFLLPYLASEVAIKEQQERLGKLTPTRVLMDCWERDAYEDTLSENLSRATGHFTFIAGRIHQNAPDADILVMRVLHPDNICYEADLLLALWLLIARVKRAHEGHPKDLVDIVSLSLGGFVEKDSSQASHLRTAISTLTGLGVLVVAAAGNDSSTRPFYPAALATEDPNTPWPGERVFGVGALNPDGTQAWFSNAGPNVTIEASGANVVSTFPTRLRGNRGAFRTTENGLRQVADPDRFRGGWAVGSGTSYAAPEVAAALANCLRDQNTVAITEVGADLMRARAEAAVKLLTDQVHANGSD